MTDPEKPLEMEKIEFNPMRSPLEALVERLKTKAGTLDAQKKRGKAADLWEVINELQDILAGREW